MMLLSIFLQAAPNGAYGLYEHGFITGRVAPTEC